jgi:hypothetical protein
MSTAAARKIDLEFFPLYAESAHIPLAKDTSRNTQKRVASCTRQAAHRYHEDLAILVAYGDVEFEAKPQNSCDFLGSCWLSVYAITAPFGWW